MKEVVFLGTKDIGLTCLKEMHKRQKELDFKIIAVLSNENGSAFREFCKEKGLMFLEHLDDLLNLEFDLLFSVQYHKILEKRHLLCVRERAFNLHLAPLPEYRGCNQFSFAILNDDSEFGVTIHEINLGIDSGDIIFEKRFYIPENCFVDELVELGNKNGIELFKEKLEHLINGNYTLTPQDSIECKKREFHLRSEIESLKCISLAGGGAFN